MAGIDNVKETLGWYKVMFGILTAIEVSLLGWFAQNYTTINNELFYVSIVVVIMCTVGIIWLNKKAFWLISSLKDM